jgi:hypothetical protein
MGLEPTNLLTDRRVSAFISKAQAQLAQVSAAFRPSLFGSGSAEVLELMKPVRPQVDRFVIDLMA